MAKLAILNIFVICCICFSHGFLENFLGSDDELWIQYMKYLQERRDKESASKGDGSKGDGSKGDGSKGDGSKGDGSKGDGSKGDGSKGDGSGSKSDSPKGDGSKGDGGEPSESGSDGDPSEGGSDGSDPSGDGTDGGDPSEGSLDGDDPSDDGSDGDPSEDDSKKKGGSKKGGKSKGRDPEDDGGSAFDDTGSPCGYAGEYDCRCIPGKNICFITADQYSDPIVVRQKSPEYQYPYAVPEPSVAGSPETLFVDEDGRPMAEAPSDRLVFVQNRDYDSIPSCLEDSGRVRISCSKSGGAYVSKILRNKQGDCTIPKTEKAKLIPASGKPTYLKLKYESGYTAPRPDEEARIDLKGIGLGGDTKPSCKGNCRANVKQGGILDTIRTKPLVKTGKVNVGSKVRDEKEIGNA